MSGLESDHDSTTEPAASAEADRAPSVAPDLGEESAVRLIEVIETILTALILAIVFRAFFVEAFIIPTGSMAGGLRGQHVEWLCENCGWEYPVGPANQAREDTFVPPVSTDCPNCHHVTDLRDAPVRPRQGDRIIVHKWPYLLADLLPIRRWDVIVFRDPVDAEQNYIKRVVGLPGDAIEILDGDVYIQRGDGPLEIARKTPAAQRVLWSVVFDQDYLPRGRAGIPHPPNWAALDDLPGWSGLDSRALHYRPEHAPIAWLRFAPAGSREYLRDVNGYNYSVAGNFVGDVRLAADVVFAAGDQPGEVALRLGRDEAVFTATLTTAGDVTLDLAAPGQTGHRAGPARVAVAPGLPVRLELSYVDRLVEVRVGGHLLLAVSADGYVRDAESLRTWIRGEPLALDVGARGRPATVRHVRIDRDVYYTYSPKTRRAGPGRAFPLEAGEYFVLGDNSPSSHDSREWHRAGSHLTDGHRPKPYRLGTVPEDQIVGRAFFVYLPGLMPVGSGTAWRIPDVGRMRFVR